MWSVGQAVRARREALGLSQESLAERLGVTNGYLSHIERGKRQPTPEQAAQFAEMLDLPHDMMLLTAGRLPADVQAVIKADPAEVAAAVRARAERAAFAHPTAPPVAPEARSAERADPIAVPPLAIKVSKASESYRAHSYHTKVPPEGIEPFIKAFTEPGDTVLDSFCGSGMTGVAALRLGRNALLSDLSPAAVHIARGYTTPCDPLAFCEALAQVTSSVRSTMAWLYTPVGGLGPTEYLTWSDVFACGACGEEILYWEAFEPGSDGVACPNCGARAAKADLAWVGDRPVAVHTLVRGRIQTRSPTPADLALITEVHGAPIPFWIPQLAFGPDREMWRASHGAMGVKDAADFYTRRNLHALAALRHAILEIEDRRQRDALMFAFTGAVNRASRRYQWNAKRPTNVMTGTLYISSLRYEWNVWSLFKRKAADVLRFYQRFPSTAAASQVYRRSATDLGCLADGSIDMVFVDPPFGSNIFYADSSLLWDAWLGEATDQASEIVVNQRRQGIGGGKNIETYGALLTQSFGELARVLRPGGRAVLAFSNADDKVWTAVQDAVSDGGFEVGSVHVLDKTQPSIKGVKAQLGEQRVTRLDLALCLSHKSTPRRRPRSIAGEAFIDASIAGARAEGHTRLDYVYSSVLRDALAADLSVQGVTMPAIERRLG
jgi:transcriptional regulator with XRE-family HTH domain/16S rRNA G966 N2-methylase RsmD